MGREDSGAGRSEAERDGVHATRSERAATGHIYIYAVHRRFVHGSCGVFREAWLRIRASGCAGPGEFRRRVRAICE